MIGPQIRIVAQLVLLFSSLANVSWAQPAARAWPLHGNSFVAPFRGLDHEGKFQFEGITSIPRNELAFWGAHADGAQESRIFLRGGGWLGLSVTEITTEHVRGESPRWGTIQLPAASVAAVMMTPPADTLERDLWLSRSLASGMEQDRLALTNGDLLRGELMLPPPNRAEGRLVWFRPGPTSEPLTLSLERIRLVVMRNSSATLPRNPRFWVGFRPGDLFPVDEITQQDGQVRFTLVNSAQVSAATEVWQDVDFIQALGEQVAYLSDLRPLGFKHIPFLDQPLSFGADRNVHGGLLRSQDAVWPKGVGMPSTSRLAFELERPYRAFQAELCLDDSAGGLGCVVFRVFVQRDDPADWSAAYTSPSVRGGDAAIPVSVELTGVRRLALIVDFSDRGDEGDDADWLNARLIK